MNQCFLFPENINETNLFHEIFILNNFKIVRPIGRGNCYDRSKKGQENNKKNTIQPSGTNVCVMGLLRMMVSL